MFSMDRLQFKITNHKCNPLQIKDIALDKSYIVIFHADKIPPHLGLITNKLFYSSKTSGVDIGLSVNRVVNLINRKSIPTLFVEINLQLSKHHVTELFSAQEGLYAENTCLSPISQSLVGTDEHEKIGDLLHRLSLNDSIARILHANLPEGYKGIPDYSREAILARINSLRHGSIVKSNT